MVRAPWRLSNTFARGIPPAGLRGSGRNSTQSRRKGHSSIRKRYPGKFHGTGGVGGALGRIGLPKCHRQRNRRNSGTDLRNASLPCQTGSAFVLRSEAHTSELQSLMRISYAVFCLKKKK